MRPAPAHRPTPPCSAAAALVVAALLALAAPGRACDRASSASAASCPPCPACPAACTASQCRGAASLACSGACSRQATAAVAARHAPARRRHAHAAGARVRPAPRPAAVATVASAPRPAGLVAVIDPATGLLVQPAPEQIGAIARATPVAPAGTARLSAHAEDPEVVRLADGTLVSTLPARLMMNMVARRDAAGRLHYDCEQGASLQAGPVLPVPPGPATWAPAVEK